MISKHERIAALLDALHSEPMVHTSFPAFAAFSHAMLAYVDDGDCAALSDPYLQSMLLALWRLYRSEGTAPLQLFNPDANQDNWHSRHSILMLRTGNKPFLIDSLRMWLTRQKLNSHLFFHADFAADDAFPNGQLLVFVEVDRQPSDQLSSLQAELQDMLASVEHVVADFDAMKTALRQFAGKSHQAEQMVPWLLDNHFTLLTVDHYSCLKEDWQLVNTLGERCDLSAQQRDLRQYLLQQPEQMFAKDLQRSQVHRPAWPDLLLFHSNDGQEVLLVRGLYTSAVYQGLAYQMPLLVDKLQAVLRLSRLPSNSHYYKELWQTLIALPLDELLLSSEERLLEVALSMVQVQERRQIRLYLRQDGHSSFASLMILVPRDLYDTSLRKQFLALLLQYLPYDDYDFETRFSESVLARAYFVLRLTESSHNHLDLTAIEYRLRLLARPWLEDLQQALLETLGDKQGQQLFQRYQHGFPMAYRDQFGSQVAVADISAIEEVTTNQLKVQFYGSEVNTSVFKMKIYAAEELALSDLIPVLENLGLRVQDEYPYAIAAEGRSTVWLYDLSVTAMDVTGEQVQQASERFVETLNAQWFGLTDSDAFNRLLLPVALDWRQIRLLRALAKYLKQIRFGLSEQYVADALRQYPDCTRLLLALFASRMQPDWAGKDASEWLAELEEAYQQVSSFTDDRLLRQYQAVIMAIVRCNYYHFHNQAQDLPLISLKLQPSLIPHVPKPHPKFEIFVYSPRVEGVHFRFGAVARGGLRWSDRQEDYRTEVLGLVKAQQVKNSVIVPVGAKGGFVCKMMAAIVDRQQQIDEAEQCYSLFISGLLCLTDNLQGDTLVHPEHTQRHDDPDPYLVVAADKGTATFSDLANRVAKRFDFWLGDAFASGGSQGYDHKKMGITARGAWISVQHHFKRLAVDVQTQSIRVIAIGDMAGDVFGNGLLLSEQLQLVAAFNHQHIFIDPNPDPQQSFSERQRLFALPRSSWSDYNAALISKGGALLSRSAKAVRLSEPAAQLLDLQAGHPYGPNEIVSAILRAKVDLLWNGGIGTYVKASHEQHAQVGDKANDGLRVDANELRVSVIGEGGNLGMTQLARVEYGLRGGLCFTDFIDNAGGVDCSDHEVNVKILLDQLQRQGELTDKHRNQRLVAMTEEVSSLVLESNYLQARVISLSQLESTNRFDEYRRLLHGLEARGRLHRQLDSLPDDAMLEQRLLASQGFTAAEISMLLSLVKGELKERLIAAKLSQWPRLSAYAQKAFPKPIREAFADAILQHPLLDELIATQLANEMVNLGGLTLVERLQLSSGCNLQELVLSYVACEQILSLGQLWQQIAQLDHLVPFEVQSQMGLQMLRLLRHACRWYLRRHRAQLDDSALLVQYQQGQQSLMALMPQYVHQHPHWQQRFQQWRDAQVPESLALHLACADFFISGLDMINLSEQARVPLAQVVSLYQGVDDLLSLSIFKRLISQLEVNSQWQMLARETLRDDLERLHRQLTQSLLNSDLAAEQTEDRLAQWQQQQPEQIARWMQFIHQIEQSPALELAIFSVALRQLSELVSLYESDG